MQTRLLMLVLLSIYSPFIFGKEQPLQIIAFGSCNHQDKPQPLWKVIAKTNPDLWIWTGDTVYADTHNPQKLSAIYNKQLKIADYSTFAKSTNIIGVWDDHDYADNNSDRTARSKVASQREFLNFLGESPNSQRRKQQGIYWHYQYGPAVNQVAIFLLVTRYHKAPWKSKNGTMLGQEQWRWLESAIKSSKADVNLIVSSIQGIPQDHRFEKWSNFPHERQRLLDLLATPTLRNPVIISGDRHISELSKVRHQGKEIWEITSSGMTHSYRGFSGEKNRHRIGKVIFQKNFGTIAFDWPKKEMRLGIIDEEGKTVLGSQLKLQ